MNIRKMFDRFKCRIGLHDWEPPFRVVYEKFKPSTTPIAEGQPMKLEKLSSHKESVDMGPCWAMCGRCRKKRLTKKKEARDESSKPYRNSLGRTRL